MVSSGTHTGFLLCGHKTEYSENRINKGNKEQLKAEVGYTYKT